MVTVTLATGIGSAQSPGNVSRSRVLQATITNTFNQSPPEITGLMSRELFEASVSQPLLVPSTFGSRYPLRKVASSAANDAENVVEAAIPCSFSVQCNYGEAIFGESSGFFGVHGKSNTDDGVFGESDSGFGIRGISNFNNGVVGETTNANGTGNGVRGTHTPTGNIGTLGGSSSGVAGSGNNSGSVGVHGTHNSSGNLGQLGTSGSGVFGSGIGIGVRGFSNGGNGVRGESPSGFGVRGDSTSGNGVVGFSNSNDAVLGFGRNGVHGQSSSASDSGVWGENLGGGYGVSGSTNSTAASGMWGQNLGSGAGVRGTSSGGVGLDGSSSTNIAIQGTSANNTGVSGRNSSTNNQGQLGTTASGVSGYHGSTFNSGHLGTGSTGVSGFHGSTGNAGYLGLSYAGAAGYGSTYGVYGYSPQGLAGYFYGNAQVTGNLSKGGGSFKIDHPLDPENKYLYHSFVESPDMKNIYDGTVKLDENGEAEVKLPEWFESLNNDFRYLLTAVGAPAPNLYISEEVKENRFKIAGGSPGLKVSWQVTGIRQDAYAKKHRIPVEEEKPDIERGFFLHPDAHGQPQEKSVEWARNPEMMRQMNKSRSQEPQQR
jgi:hypothetical protein